MTILEIIEFSVLTVVVLSLSIYYIILAIKNKWLKELTHTIDCAIADAEKKFPAGHGEEKKKIVLDAVIKKCEELGIPYHLLQKLISKLIDKIIANYNIVVKL